MMTGVQNIVTSKHATYLEFPPLGFEPRTDLWSLQTQDLVKKTSPGGKRTGLKEWKEWKNGKRRKGMG